MILRSLLQSIKGGRSALTAVNIFCLNQKATDLSVRDIPRICENVVQLIPKIKINDHLKRKLSVDINRFINHVYFYCGSRKNNLTNLLSFQAKNAHQFICGQFTPNNELKIIVDKIINKESFYVTTMFRLNNKSKKKKLNYNWKDINRLNNKLQNDIDISFEMFINKFIMKQMMHCLDISQIW